MATLGHKVSVQAHRATQVWSGRSPDGLTEADPRGRLSRKHRVCGGKPTNGSNRRRRRRHSDGECMEDRGRGGGRNLGRSLSLSLSISPPLSRTKLFLNGAAHAMMIAAAMMMTTTTPTIPRRESLTLLYGDGRADGSRRADELMCGSCHCQG